MDEHDLHGLVQLHHSTHNLSLMVVDRMRGIDNLDNDQSK